MIFENKPAPKKSSTKILAAGLGITSLALVGAVAFGVGQFKAQQQQMAILENMAAQVSDLQSLVTRNASTQILTVPVVEPVIEDAVVAQPAKPELTAQERENLVTEARATAARIKLERLTKGLIVGQLAQSVVDGDFEITSTDRGNGTTDIAFTPNTNRATAALIEQVIAESVNAGVITLPSENGTSDGGINTSALLFDLVERSLEAGDTEQQEAAGLLRQEAFAASKIQSEIVDGKRYYTVQSGDSLAYIALQFYGSTRQFAPIFEANSDRLNSPDQIQIGQRLIIPQI